MKKTPMVIVPQVMGEPGCVRVFLYSLTDTSRLSADDFTDIAVHVLEEYEIKPPSVEGVVAIDHQMDMCIVVSFASMEYADQHGWDVPLEFRVGEALNA